MNEKTTGVLNRTLPCNCGWCKEGGAPEVLEEDFYSIPRAKFKYKFRIQAETHDVTNPDEVKGFIKELSDMLDRYNIYYNFKSVNITFPD